MLLQRNRKKALSPTAVDVENLIPTSGSLKDKYTVFDSNGKKLFGDCTRNKKTIPLCQKMFGFEPKDRAKKPTFMVVIRIFVSKATMASRFIPEIARQNHFVWSATASLYVGFN